MRQQSGTIKRPLHKCTHYWKINDDDKGVCEYCSEERQFARRGEIDWYKVRKGAHVRGKSPRVILPFITSEV